MMQQEAKLLRAVVVSVTAALALTSCSSQGDSLHERLPGPKRGCYIYCSDNRPTIFKRQHICPGGTRWFYDIWITGETKEDYLSEEGNYPKEDVELSPCDAYIRTLIN